MSSKQEKLAAARKKLREFQGKAKPSNGINGNSVESTDCGKTDVINNSSSNVSTSSTPVFQDGCHQPLAKFFETESPKPIFQETGATYNTNAPSDRHFPQPFSDAHVPYQDVPFDRQSVSPAVSSSPMKYLEETRVTPNSESGLTDVLRPLQLQLQNHVQTIAILVAERNELQQVLSRIQAELFEKTGEVAVLKGRVQSSEAQTHTFQESLAKYEETLRSVQQERDYLRTQAQTIKAEETNAREVSQEMRAKMEAKSRECEILMANLQNLQGELSMAHIKLQQLSDGNTVGPQLFELQSENKRLVQRSQELEKQLHQAVSDKEQSSQNFQIYAQQCNSQISLLKKQMDHLISENQGLVEKNTNLNRLIQEKEMELERESPASEMKEAVAQLQGQAGMLTAANHQLQEDCSSKEEELARLRAELREREAELEDCINMLAAARADNTTLQGEVENRDSNEKLLAAMESDKVAAARAVTQNVKLKEQLVELEQGFIKVSDEKLDLTEKLQHERFVNKELTERLQQVDLSGRGSHGDHTHREDEDCCHDHDHEAEARAHEDEEEDVTQLRNIINQLQDDKAELLSRLSAVRNGSRQSQREESDADTPEVVKQMEEKVCRTMNEIAVLDEEKQKLEHLVLQLQGETETIGEYISLYQKQRTLLRLKTKEKDEQLLQLSQDREELKEKLAALDQLVQSLLGEKQEGAGATQVQPGTGTGTEEALGDDHTADKIRALITEIGSTNLVSPSHVSFEHCQCCSGRLITI